MPARLAAARSQALALRARQGPVSALLAADLTLLRRSPSALAQLVGLTALMIIAQQVPAFTGGFGLFVLLVVAGFRAAQLGAEGARTAEMVPALDAMVPLSARDGRLARAVTPRSQRSWLSWSGPCRSC
ncbi:hypothetical protein NKG05_01025 [Oerskovia sp. M15]